MVRLINKQILTESVATAHRFTSSNRIYQLVFNKSLQPQNVYKVIENNVTQNEKNTLKIPMSALSDIKREAQPSVL